MINIKKIIILLPLVLNNVVQTMANFTNDLLPKKVEIKDDADGKIMKNFRDSISVVKDQKCAMDLTHLITAFHVKKAWAIASKIFANI